MIDSERLIGKIDVYREKEKDLLRRMKESELARFDSAVKVLDGLKYDIMQAGRAVHHWGHPLLFTGVKAENGTRLAFRHYEGLDGSYRVGLQANMRHTHVDYLPFGFMFVGRNSTDVGRIRKGLAENGWRQAVDDEMESFSEVANAIVELSAKYTEMERWLAEYFEKLSPDVPGVSGAGDVES